MVNQCTKFKVSRFTRYKAMNGGAKYRKWGGFGWFWGTQGHGQCHHSIERYDFLFDFNRNYVSNFYRFRDIASYLSKVADFDPLHLHLAPLQRASQDGGLSCGVVCVILRLTVFCRTPTCVRHRQTDGHRALKYTAHA